MINPHATTPTLTVGPDPKDAAAALVLVHGRGASADGMLPLVDALGVGTDVAVLAPQAANYTWYPYSFLVPMEQNQPYLDSALLRLKTVVDGLIEQGIPSERIALLGFSQGACLTLEYVARNPRRYGAVMALSGGLIGPPGTPRNYDGSLEGTSVFIGAMDPDSHIPIARANESRDGLAAMNANVDLRRYPGQPHTINADEVNACRTLLQSIAVAASNC